MKYKILSIIALLTMSAGISLKAQENDSTVHKSVTVTREFKPMILDAGKIITAPQIVEPVVERTVPVYSDVSVPLNIDYNVHLLKAHELQNRASDANRGFARVGFGSPINTLADFSYPVISNDKNLLDVNLHHLGAFKDKVHSQTSAAVRYNHLFKKVDLYAGLGGSHDFFNYYGRNFLRETPVILSDIANNNPNLIYNSPEEAALSLRTISAMPLNNTHWRVGGVGGLRSLPGGAERLQFDANLYYNLFSSVANRLNENIFGLKGEFVVPFDENRLGMLVEFSNMVYSAEQGFNFNFPEGYTIMRFNPYVTLSGDKYLLHLGLKANLSAGHGTIFTPAPDVRAEWFALPSYLSLYAGVGGGLQVNTLSDSYRENRFLAPQVRINDTYTPIDAYLGLKLSPVHNLMLDFYGQFKTVQNQYFYVNRLYELSSIPPVNSEGYNYDKFFHNRFDVLYSAAARASLGFRANWEFRDLLQIYAKGAYHHWNVKDQARAWHMPQWEGDFGARVNVMNDLNITAQFVYQDGRYALLHSADGVKLPAVTDLNLSATYVFNTWASFFLKANNLMNNKHHIFNGYEVQGINVMGGVAFSF